MKKTKFFIALFAGSLLLPNLVFFPFQKYFDTKNNENRELAAFPKIRAAGWENFSADFEAYYNDHVPFKNDFVKFNNMVDTSLFRTTKLGDVVIGKDNWLFYLTSRNGEDAAADYQKTNLYTEEESRKTANQIIDTETWFKNQGVERFACYIAPNKETLYPEQMPEKPVKRGEGPSRMDAFAAYMEENTSTAFGWLADDLQKYAPDYQLFCKYDSHMNNLGGYFISEKILQDFGFDPPEISDFTITDGDTYQGDLARMIGREEELTDDVLYCVEGYQPDVSCEAVQEEVPNGEEIFREFSSDSTNSKTLLVIGDSFRLRLEGYLPYWYQKCVFVHIDHFTPELMEKYQPQDVAVILVERDQHYMEELSKYFMENEKK